MVNAIKLFRNNQQQRTMSRLNGAVFKKSRKPSKISKQTQEEAARQCSRQHWQLQTRLRQSGTCCTFRATHSKHGATIVSFAKRGTFDIEEKVYSALSKANESKGFPRLIACLEKNIFSALIIDDVADTLHDKLRALGQLPIRLRTVLSIGIQLMDRLQSLHSLGYVHRSLNIENIGVGRSNTKDEHIVFLFNFRCARKFVSSQCDQTEQALREADFEIPLLFAPIEYHEGNELCRKDDIESLIYVLILLAKRKLPWQHIMKFKINPLHDEIKLMKKDPKRTELFKGLPMAFEQIWTSVRSLKFNKSPNYSAIRTFLRTALKEIEADHEDELIWTY